MRKHMPSTEAKIEELRTAAMSALVVASEPHHAMVAAAEARLDAATQDASNREADASAAASELKQIESVATAVSGPAHEPLEQALVAAREKVRTLQAELERARLTKEHAQEEVAAAQASYQQQIDLHRAMSSLLTTFTAERAQMERDVQEEAIRQWQFDCAERARDYVKPYHEMSYEERRDSDPTR